MNQEQKAAVDQTEGPVMVIAGPGTGKTQILAVRIGKILLDQQVAPHNILCLTFTEAAAYSMRDRLSTIIGPAAHQVRIHTFHGFCNQVIQENPETFGNSRQANLISDLESIELFQRIHDELKEDHPIKKLKSGVDLEMMRLRNLFSVMKQENLSESLVHTLIEDYIERQKSGTDFRYKVTRGDFKKGDLKIKEWAKFEDKMVKVKAASSLYKKYNELLQEANLIDYHDMILKVIRAFETDRDFLLNYQEQFQYFLVDEFQDTNGAQQKILELLINYWEDSPNVFVVGDDDQAIYRFQGADLSNITRWHVKYDPEVVILSTNYRSDQKILNGAKSLISHQGEENSLTLEGVHEKHLNSYKSSTGEKFPTILECPNPMAEEAILANQLEQRMKQGNLSSMAVIYRNHKQVQRLISVLEKRGIPLNISKKVNILEVPLILNILMLLRYISRAHSPGPIDDLHLFEIMHFRFFGISSLDVAKIMTYCTQQRPHLRLREQINNRESLGSLDLETVSQIERLAQLLDKWSSDVSTLTLQSLFQNIINEGNILTYVLDHSDKTWLLQLITSLFDHIKDETTRNPTLDLATYLENIDKMTLHQISLEVNKVTHSRDGVHFITAHSSKGLEFDHVWILGANVNIWKNRTTSWGHYSYPEGMNNTSISTMEDERRLFYVAMTRAKSDLRISYSKTDDKGKATGKVSFVDEIEAKASVSFEQPLISEDVITNYMADTLSLPVREVSLLDQGLIENALAGYALSVTGLNKYLRCPLTFYYEDILRVPSARTKYMGFGSAVHQALEFYYLDKKKATETNSSSILSHFDRAMNQYRQHFTKQEFNDMHAYGTQILPGYIEKVAAMEDKVVDFELEAKIQNVQYQGIPLKGLLDKVKLYKDFVEVTDYKTGSFNNTKTRSKLKAPTDNNPLGGDYWRQIVFYKILLDADKKRNWIMRRGEISFIEPDKISTEYKSLEFEVTGEDILLVGEQIKTSWSKIQNHDFAIGCGEEDCKWCEFVRDELVYTTGLIEFNES